MAKSKTKNKDVKIYFSVIRLIVFLVLSMIIVASGIVFKDKIEIFINGKEISSNEIDYNGLVVHYIDVGQGDAIMIELPDDKKMLIDAGPKSSVTQLIDYLNEKVFNDEADKEIDYVLLTHSDEDHCGGMPTIFSTYQVNMALRPQIYANETDKDRDDNAGTKVLYKDTNIYKNTIKAMENEPNCEMVYTTKTLMNTMYKISGGVSDEYYEFYFYTPNESYYSEVNDYSPIMTLTYRNRVFMFTGDASTSVEAEITTTLPKVDVLKVGHHGSTTSSSKVFLNKITPTYSIIEVGKDNKYNHPNDEIIQRLTELNSKIYRTDENQNIVVNVSSTGDLLMCSDIGNKGIKAIYCIIGAELILLYFCFCVKYQTKK